MMTARDDLDRWWTAHITRTPDGALQAVTHITPDRTRTVICFSCALGQAHANNVWLDVEEVA